MFCLLQEYIDKHELSRRVEEAINATVKSKPDEPLAFLVRCLCHCDLRSCDLARDAVGGFIRLSECCCRIQCRAPARNAGDAIRKLPPMPSPKS